MSRGRASLAAAALLLALAASAPAAAGGRPEVRVALGQSVAHVFSVGAPVDVTGRVRGDVYAVGADVTLGPHAVVLGNVGVLGGDLTVSPGARVSGFVLDVDLARLTVGPLLVLLSLSLAWTLFRFLVAAALWAVGVLLALGLPGLVASLGQRFLLRPARCALPGLYSLALAVVLALVAAGTLVLLPVGLGILFVTGCAAVCGMAGVGAALGEVLATRFDLPWPGGGRRTALGLGLLMVGSLVPLVGPLFLAVVALLGLGLVAVELHLWLRSR
jgi:hypothetical protein